MGPPHGLAVEDGARGGSGVPAAYTFRDRSGVLHDGLSRYFNHRALSDLTVVAPDGGKIHCHQLLLSACSRRFAEVLEQGTLRGDELPVRGVDSLGLHLVLRFFYTGECVMDYMSVIPIYDAAHRLDVPSLAEACSFYSQAILGNNTVCTLLQHALRFSMGDYAHQCSRIIRGSFDSIASGEDFLTLELSTLMRVLVENMQFQNEGSIFKAAWRWGMSSLGRMQLMPEVFKVVKVPNLSMADLLKLAGPLPGPVGTYSVRTPGDLPQRNPPNPGSAARLSSAQQFLIQHMLGGMDLVKAVRLTQQEFGTDTDTPAPQPPVPPCLMLGGVVTNMPLRMNAPGANVQQGGVAVPNRPHQTFNIDSLPSQPATAPGLPNNGQWRSHVPHQECAAEVANSCAASGGHPPPHREPAHPQQQQVAAGHQQAQAGAPRPAKRGGNCAAGEREREPARGQLHHGGTVVGGGEHSGTVVSGTAGSGGSRNDAVSGAAAPQEGNPHPLARMIEEVQAAAAPGGNVVIMLNLPKNMMPLANGGRSTGPAAPAGAAPARGASGPGRAVCQVDGCGQQLSDNSARHRVCDTHARSWEVTVDGALQRFCQGCGKLHPLHHFDQDKRTCRARSAKGVQAHLARRRKRVRAEDGEDMDLELDAEQYYDPEDPPRRVFSGPPAGGASAGPGPGMERAGAVDAHPAGVLMVGGASPPKAGLRGHACRAEGDGARHGVRRAAAAPHDDVANSSTASGGNAGSGDAGGMRNSQPLPPPPRAGPGRHQGQTRGMMPPAPVLPRAGTGRQQHQREGFRSAGGAYEAAYADGHRQGGYQDGDAGAEYLDAAMPPPQQRPPARRSPPQHTRPPQRSGPGRPVAEQLGSDGEDGEEYQPWGSGGQQPAQGAAAARPRRYSGPAVVGPMVGLQQPSRPQQRQPGTYHGPPTDAEAQADEFGGGYQAQGARPQAQAGAGIRSRSPLPLRRLSQPVAGSAGAAAVAGSAGRGDAAAAPTLANVLQAAGLPPNAKLIVSRVPLTTGQGPAGAGATAITIPPGSAARAPVPRSKPNASAGQGQQGAPRQPGSPRPSTAASHMSCSAPAPPVQRRSGGGAMEPPAAMPVPRTNSAPPEPQQEPQARNLQQWCAPAHTPGPGLEQQQGRSQRGQGADSRGQPPPRQMQQRMQQLRQEYGGQYYGEDQGQQPMDVEYAAAGSAPAAPSLRYAPASQAEVLAAQGQQVVHMGVQQVQMQQPPLPLQLTPAGGPVPASGGVQAMQQEAYQHHRKSSGVDQHMGRSSHGSAPDYPQPAAPGQQDHQQQHGATPPVQYAPVYHTQQPGWMTGNSNSPGQQGPSPGSVHDQPATMLFPTPQDQQQYNCGQSSQLMQQQGQQGAWDGTPDQMPYPTPQPTMPQQHSVPQLAAGQQQACSAPTPMGPPLADGHTPQPQYSLQQQEQQAQALKGVDQAAAPASQVVVPVSQPQRSQPDQQPHHKATPEVYTPEHAVRLQHGHPGAGAPAGAAVAPAVAGGAMREANAAPAPAPGPSRAATAGPSTANTLGLGGFSGTVSSFGKRLGTDFGLRVSVNGNSSFGDMEPLITPGSALFDIGLVSPNTELFNMLNQGNPMEDTMGPVLDILNEESLYDDTAATQAGAGR